MDSESKLYRVLVLTTSSLQPDSSGTFWNRNVVYCGYDRAEAVRVYHANTPADYFCGYGNRCRRTVGQSKSV